MYKIFVNKKQLLPSTYCKVLTGNKQAFVEAYSIERLKDVIIDAGNSINSQ
jgi:hypothetical protein